MKATLYKDMDINEYHSKTDVISKSMLQKFSDCPARYKYLYIDGGEGKKTKALQLGNLVHTLALEPELYKKRYAITPETYTNDKGEDKPWRNDMRIKAVMEWHAENDDKIIITSDDKKQAEAMARSITKDKYARKLLEGDGYVEASIFFEYKGLKFRCRPDDMKNSGVLNDLKITRSNKPGMFRADAWNYGYHLSVALTSLGYEALYGKKPDNYTFICVEQELPYIVQCYDTYRPFDPVTGLSLYDMGMYQLDRLIDGYNESEDEHVRGIKECLEEGVWPAYFEGIKPLGAPHWAVKQMLGGE